MSLARPTPPSPLYWRSRRNFLPDVHVRQLVEAQFLSRHLACRRGWALSTSWPRAPGNSSQSLAEIVQGRVRVHVVHVCTRTRALTLPSPTLRRRAGEV